MDNQFSIFDFLGYMDEPEKAAVKADNCFGCIFDRGGKCKYIKESESDFCYFGDKRLGVGDHIYSVSGGKITNLIITNTIGCSDNYFTCEDRNGNITYSSVLSIREWWDVSYELIKKSRFYVEKKVNCKYSGHSCNKKELFRLAEEMNPFCPHVCCRLCSEKICGVRCNGAT